MMKFLPPVMAWQAALALGTACCRNSCGCHTGWKSAVYLQTNWLVLLVLFPLDQSYQYFHEVHEGLLDPRIHENLF